MEIKSITGSDKHEEENDYRLFFVLEVNGKRRISVSDGEPEDANLARDFSDVWSVVSLMKEAFEAGKNGEELNIEELESDEWV